MFATLSRRRRELGSSLVVVTMLVTAVASFALLTVQSATSHYRSAKSRLEGTKAFYVAEGGMDWCLGQLAKDRWFPARQTSVFPVVTEGSFTTGWMQLGDNGGTFQATIRYVTNNTVDPSWNGKGFPPGFVPLIAVGFANRTSATPSFDGIEVVVNGRYGDGTGWVKAGIKFQTTLFGGAIVSDAEPVDGSGSGKSFAMDDDVIVLDADREYVYGGVVSNGGVYVAGSSTPVTRGTAPVLLDGWNGNVQQNLYGTGKEIPDFTDPGSSTQLFDFDRFYAAASKGAGAVYPNLASFCSAMRTANASGKSLQGIVYVTIDPAVEGSGPKIDTTTSGLGVGSAGINVQGTLVFHFVNAPDRFYKVFGEAPIHINAGANGATFDPADPTTFKTGYPPVLPASKDPRNVDISSLGFENFGSEDDLPALMFDNGTVDIHHETNICGAVYSPSFMEIENKHNARQYFNGCIISGGGVYFDSGSAPGVQVVNYDSATVDTLATYDMRAQTPTLVTYASGR
jgi:hypothetical protein